MKHLIMIGAAVAVGFICLLILRPFFPPELSFLGGYLDQAAGYVQTAIGGVTSQVQDVIGQYMNTLPAMVTAGAGGIVTAAGALYKKYKDRQMENLEAEKNAQLFQADKAFANLSEKATKLEIENGELEARLEKLQDVEGTLAELQAKFDAKVSEVDRLTAERNAVERVSIDKIAETVEEKIQLKKVIE